MAVKIRKPGKAKPVKGKKVRGKQVKRLRCDGYGDKNKGCDQFYPPRQLTRDEEDFRWRCITCMQKHARWMDTHPVQVQQKIEEPTGWYILHVEAGKEAQVRRDINRATKIAGLGDRVHEIFSATMFEDRLIQKAGDLVKDEDGETICGHSHDPRVCRTLAEQKIKELGGVVLHTREDEHEYISRLASSIAGEERPGFRPVVYRSEKHGWEWKLRHPSTAPAERKSVRVPKFPGYLFCQLTYNNDLKDVIQKVKNCWGFLIQPVAGDFRIKLSYSEIKMRWNWRVVHRDTLQTILRGHHKDRGHAETNAEKALADVEAFQPSCLPDKVGLNHYLTEKIIRRIANNREVKNRPNLGYKVGDSVLCINGAWENQTARVMEILDADKPSCMVKIEVRLWGNPIPVMVKWDELKLAK